MATSGYKCVECDAIEKFISNEEGYKVCTNCGLVYGSECTEYPTFVWPDDLASNNIFEEQEVDSGKVQSFKGTYNRRAHLNERLSAVLLSDPELPKEVAEVFKKYWDELFKQDYWTRTRVSGRTIDKRDIRKLLRFVDSREKSKKKYTIQYLERWKSIRELLTGIKGEIYTPEQVSKVGTLFMKLSGIWDFWQPPGWKQERTVWRFKDRKHFPNFNFIFQKIHSLLGPDYKKFNKDFPLPANYNSRKRLEKYWLAILPQLANQNIYKQKKTKQLSITEFQNGNKRRKTGD